MKKTMLTLLIVALAGLVVLPLAALAQSQPEPGALASATARAYQKASRYPAWSKVLPVGAEDPILAERTPSIITVGHEGEPVLAVWSRKVSYVDPTAIDFFARVEGAEVATITGEIVGQDGELVGTLRFFDDGAGFDKSAADGVFSARAAMTKSLPRPELAASYLVKILATYADGTSQRTSTGFLYSNPHARLLGRYRDRMVDGNLVIQAKVEVEKAGRFHLAGTLASLDGSPIGTAQTAVELEPGRHWIDLTFYGLMFHDRGVSGPFRLSTLALTTTGGMPNALSDVVVDAHVTRAVPLKALTARPYGDPDLLETAKRLEIEAKVSRAGLEK